MGAAPLRTPLLALAVLAMASVVGTVSLGWTGDAGWILLPGARDHAAVAWVTPAGAAQHAGIRTGDQIDVRAMPVADRVFALDLPLAGQPFVVPLQRAGSRVAATLVAPRRVLSWDNWLGNAIIFWMALFGALIAWRRPNLVEARLLSVALSCYVLGDALQTIITPWPWVNLAIVACSSAGVVGAIALGALIAYSARFGARTVLRRAIDTFAYGVVALLGLYGVASAVAIVTLWLDPADLYLGTFGTVVFCAALCVVLLAGLAALSASRGEERQRVGWALLAFGTLLAVTVLQIALNQAFPTRDVQIATQTFVNLAAIVSPVGLTYAVLSRRLLDIGFVLNRAAVFSVVSLVVVGTFMLIEWALGNWLTSATNVIVSALLAVCLGFSIRFIHDRVDHVVDRAFFRKRHEQEKALLRFAHEAAFVTSIPALIERTMAEIAQHSEAGSVLVLLRDSAGGYASAGTFVEENAPAIVAMRATQERVDLHAHPGSLAGEYAFPLVSRGELLGVLTCGAKPHGDPYAPDELETLDAVAHSVGVALGALGVEAVPVQQRLAELQLDLAALRAEMRALTGALGSSRFLTTLAETENPAER